ncbi:MAG: ABC-type nitrate/sulfonate/taurine/bicarbonate transport system periplasmic component [Desulfotomaculum sp. 46_296]|nr:MAG: ABC-type nitrate/sulfonate/taurine/bicarbonate transport system periplasmic component [Desulfotomaculum sp. 46_296]
MIRRVQPVLILVILFVISCVLAFGSLFLKHEQEQQAKKPAQIRVFEDGRSLMYLPQYIAVRQGFFKQENLDVEITTVSTRESLLYSITENRCDLAVTGLEFAIYKRAEGKGELTAFAALADKDFSFLLSRKITENFEWPSLKYKTVVTGYPGDRGTVLFKGALVKHGLVPNHQVTLYNNIPESFQIGAFESGTGDFALAEEPEASRLEAEEAGRIVASLGEETGDIPAAVCLADKKYLKDNHDVIARYVQALNNALLWLNQQSTSGIVNLVGQDYQDFDPGILAKAIDRCRKLGAWPSESIIKPSGYNNLQDFLIEAREIPKAIPYKKVVVKVS